ncbi:MAG: ORF6N domain-containing protein [Agathobacter sp.]
MGEQAKEDTSVVTVTEDLLKDRLYEFRGRKVMLDSDLSEIYGYETKNFKRQVNNNIAKFEGDDFMFELTDEETELLSRCKNFTLNKKGGRGANIKYNPYVFTEQGIYMLMTVLRGELAIKQSRALVRTFKKMKDCILENQGLIGQREMLQLCMQATDNQIEISKLHMDIGSLEKKISDVAEGLNDVVTKSELADMMSGFVTDGNKGWLIFNTKYCSADVAYSSIYSQAKSSIYVVDNYIGLRTLVLLKNAPIGVDIKLFSDNIGSKKLHNVEYTDFCKEYPGICISMYQTGGVLHDRFIVLDYGTADERVFLCGASSKDAGARITSIVEDFGIQKYSSMINSLLKNKALVLS